MLFLHYEKDGMGCRTTTRFKALHKHFYNRKSTVLKFVCLSICWGEYQFFMSEQQQRVRTGKLVLKSFCFEIFFFSWRFKWCSAVTLNITVYPHSITGRLIFYFSKKGLQIFFFLTKIIPLFIAQEQEIDFQWQNHIFIWYQPSVYYCVLWPIFVFIGFLLALLLFSFFIYLFVCHKAIMPWNGRK